MNGLSGWDEWLTYATLDQLIDGIVIAADDGEPSDRVLEDLMDELATRRLWAE